jgi:hypothetical protein
MPTEPGQLPVSPPPDAARRRLHIHGIKEMPAGYDAEVAELFRDLRAASAMSENDLAARLGTRADVVQALEQGALYALPPWAETCRVVNAYGAMLNLDVRPLLRRIYAQLEAGIVELRPKTMPDVPVMTPPESTDFAFETDRPAPSSSPSPLDIQWDPAPPSAPPRTSRPAAPSAPSQNAWPNAAPSPAPQAPWPNAAPSPFPQSWPEAAPPPPQAPWPNATPSRPAAPQVQPDRRPPPPRPAQAQAQAPQSQPQPQPRPQPQQQPPPRQKAQPQPPPPRMETASAAAGHMPAEEKARKRPALLKWAIGALIVSVLAFGLWIVLSKSSGPSGAISSGTGDTQDRVLDPDDPRSRKADRLPSPF